MPLITPTAASFPNTRHSSPGLMKPSVNSRMLTATAWLPRAAAHVGNDRQEHGQGDHGRERVLMHGDDAGGHDVEHDVDAQPAQPAHAADPQRHRAQLLAADDAHEFQEAAVRAFFGRLLDVGVAHDAHQHIVLVHGRHAEQRVAIEKPLQLLQPGRIAHFQADRGSSLATAALAATRATGRAAAARRPVFPASKRHTHTARRSGDSGRRGSAGRRARRRTVKWSRYARYSVIISPPAESGGYDISRRVSSASSAGIASRIADASSSDRCPMTSANSLLGISLTIAAASALGSRSIICAACTSGRSSTSLAATRRGNAFSSRDWSKSLKCEIACTASAGSRPDDKLGDCGRILCCHRCLQLVERFASGSIRHSQSLAASWLGG